MSLPDRMLCAKCGYDRRAVYARDPFLPCPECGDDGCAGELKPWPSKPAIAGRLLGVQLVVVMLAAGLIVQFPQEPCLVFLLPVFVFVVVLGVPFGTAGALVKRHCPARNRTRLTFLLVLLGWLGGLVLTIVAYALAVYFVAALRGIGGVVLKATQAPLLGA